MEGEVRGGDEREVSVGREMTRDGDGGGGDGGAAVRRRRRHEGGGGSGGLRMAVSR